MGDLQTAPPKLKDGINKKLLNLSSSLPDDLEELYVSIPELKQRLIFGGVDPSLLTHILNYDGTSQQWDVADSSEWMMNNNIEPRQDASFVLSLSLMPMIFLDNGSAAWWWRDN